MPARENQERGKGTPLTDESRIYRHFEETGEWLDKPPERGTGLSGLGSSGSVNDWLTANWKWVLGITGGLGILYYMSRGKK